MTASTLSALTGRLDPAQPRWQRMVFPVGVALGCCAAGAVVLAADPTQPGGWSPVCPTKALLGITCPGCGMQRAIYSLLHGRFGDALHYNALGLVALVFLAVLFGQWTVERWRGVALRRRIDKFALSAWIFGGAAVIWLVIRNIPVAPFTGLHV